MDDKAKDVPAVLPPELEAMIDAWHREHFAGMPVEVWNASAKAVADLKAKLAKT